MILEHENEVVAAHYCLEQHHFMALAWYYNPSRWLSIRLGRSPEASFGASSDVFSGATPRLSAIAEVLNGYARSSHAKRGLRAKDDRAPMPPPLLSQLLDKRLQHPLGEAAPVMYYLWEEARRTPRGSYLSARADNPAVAHVLKVLNQYLEQRANHTALGGPPTIADILSDAIDALRRAPAPLEA